MHTAWPLKSSALPRQGGAIPRSLWLFVPRALTARTQIPQGLWAVSLFTWVILGSGKVLLITLHTGQPQQGALPTTAAVRKQAASPALLLGTAQPCSHCWAAEWDQSLSRSSKEANAVHQLQLPALYPRACLPASTPQGSPAATLTFQMQKLEHRLLQQSPGPPSPATNTTGPQPHSPSSFHAELRTSHSAHASLSKRKSPHREVALTFYDKIQ